MRSQQSAFTLVELLVVIAIIGILISLLLPAVQAARESARRTECTNHLNNLTLGMINLESATGQLPSSGWLGHWTGDPDRGSGKDQPGCWLFAVFPYIEEQALHDMGQGLTGAARMTALQQRDSTPIKVANCPTRRGGGPYSAPGKQGLSGDGTGEATRYPYTSVARSDYAANVGDETDFDARCLLIAPERYDVVKPGFPPKATAYTGVSFCGTAVKLRQITDGTSKTIALGEKWLPVAYYDGSQTWAADDWGMLVGFQDDTVRSTFYDGRDSTHTPRSDTDDLATIEGEIGNVMSRELFGSAHPGGCLFSMCDGSVSLLTFEVDAELFRQMGHRADDQIDKVFKRR